MSKIKELEINEINPYLNRQFIEKIILKRYDKLTENHIDLTSADSHTELPDWINIEIETEKNPSHYFDNELNFGNPQPTLSQRSLMAKYGDPRGKEEVRESLSCYFRDELGIETSTENVIITQGINNGLITILKSLKTKSDNKGFEDDGRLSPELSTEKDDYNDEKKETASVASDTDVRENRIAFVTAARNFYTIPNETYIDYKPLETNFIAGDRLDSEALREELDKIIDSGEYDEIVFYVSNPDNPSGSVISQEEIDRIETLLKEEKYKNVVVINDLAYAGTQFETKKIPVIQSERFYTAIGLSKLGGAGHRIAAIQMHDEQNSETINSTLFSINIFPHAESQHVLQRFYGSENKALRDQFLENSSRELYYRSKLMRTLINGIEDTQVNGEELNKMIDDLTTFSEITPEKALEKLTKGMEGKAKVINNPEGSFFSIIDFPSVLHSKNKDGEKIKNVFDVATTLFHEDKLFMLPAAIFRLGSDKYKIKKSSQLDTKGQDSSCMRVSHSIPIETIINFCQRLEMVNKKYSERKNLAIVPDSIFMPDDSTKTLLKEQENKGLEII